MAAALEVSYGINTQNLSTTTTYNVGDSYGSINETNATLTRTAGTYSNLYVRITANTVTATSTFKFRKNTANGTGSISITASATGDFTDPVGTDSVVAGNKVAMQLVAGGSGTSLTATTMAVQFSASTDTAKRLVMNSASGFAATGTQRFMGLSGGAQGGTNATETQVQYKMRTAGTLTNLFVVVGSNTLNQITTVVSRINTANGALTVSIGVSTTGVFEDTSHSDTLASGTLACYGVSTVAGFTGAISFGLASELTTTNAATQLFCCDTTAFNIQAVNVTRYYAVGGILIDPNAGTPATVESTVQVQPQLSTTMSNMMVNLSANTVTAASTLNFRKNTANGNQTLSITASTTGFFEDAVNSDSLISTDEINYQLITGATGTSLAPKILGALLTAPIAIGIQPGILTPRFVYFDTGQYSLGA